MLGYLVYTGVLVHTPACLYKQYHKKPWCAIMKVCLCGERAGPGWVLTLNTAPSKWQAALLISGLGMHQPQNTILTPLLSTLEASTWILAYISDILLLSIPLVSATLPLWTKVTSAPRPSLLTLQNKEVQAILCWSLAISLLLTYESCAQLQCVSSYSKIPHKMSKDSENRKSWVCLR